MPPSFHFVLMRPRNAENLGAAARALKNFGFERWTWVAPWARAEDEAAVKMAVHAEDVLRNARTAKTLAEAVADSAWVVATSSRRVRGKRSLSPRAFAAEASDRARDGTVALVFGDERSGLRNDEVDCCHDLSSIPAGTAQPSINLAQSLLLYSYELRVALLERAPAAPAPLPAAATDAELRALEAAAADALRARGFLHDDRRHALRDLLRPLLRARLSRDEAALWRAALHVLRKGRGGE